MTAPSKRENQLLAGPEDLGISEDRNLNCSHLDGCVLWLQQGFMRAVVLVTGTAIYATPHVTSADK